MDCSSTNAANRIGCGMPKNVGKATKEGGLLSLIKENIVGDLNNHSM